MLSFLLALEGAEAESVPPNPILPAVPEMVWGAIAFGTLWALVKFVLLPPVLKIMAERADQVRSDYDAADVAKSNAGSAATAVADQLVDVRAEAAVVVDAARNEAEAERAKLISAAEADVAELRGAADAEIETARATALAGIRPQVAEVATSAASRVMNRDIDLGSATGIVDRFLDNPN